MSTVSAIPSRQLIALSLLSGATRAEDLTPDLAAGLLEDLAALLPKLVARAAAQPGAKAPDREPGDRLLVPAEAARRLGVNVDWLYRRWRSLPFARKLSPKVLRFSEAGLSRYLAKNGP